MFGKTSAAGRVFKDNGYVSTSTESGFGGNTKIQIKVPAGAKVLKVGDHGGVQGHGEHEFLLPRGSRFKVLSDTGPVGSNSYGKTRYVTVELIP
jgi:hypothetical protein